MGLSLQRWHQQSRGSSGIWLLKDCPNLVALRMRDKWQIVAVRHNPGDTGFEATRIMLRDTGFGAQRFETRREALQALEAFLASISQSKS
jgi:hypothetical protein